MENNCILFDDWATRYDTAFNHRKSAYILSLICPGFMLSASIIGLFFDWSLIVMLILSLIVLINVILEWLKIKNSHLVIRENQIEITNRFSKTTIYPINMENIVLELKHSFNRRSGGIIMKFYDSNANLICKYEDMLNSAAPFGVTQTNWEKAITTLGLRIKDPGEIIKNK